MMIRKILVFFIFGAAIFSSGNCVAQVFKPGLSDFRIVQFASVKGENPRQIMRYDNNSDVLIACRSGKTAEQLKAMDIPVLQSQLALLEAYRLISVQKKVIKTAVPILMQEDTRRMRVISRKAADAMVPLIRPDVEKLAGELKKGGREKNIYSILFAYVLDSMVWDDFLSEELIHPIKITAETPFWSGEIWAYYPRRDFSCGTNSHGAGNARFKVNWNNEANTFLGKFYSAWSKHNKDFREGVGKGKIENDEIKHDFAPFNILNADGTLSIPEIVENDANEIYRISRDISQKTAQKAPQLISLSDITSDFGFRDSKLALVIMYHEIMWDMMDSLEDAGLIAKPVILKDAGKASPADVADIMIVVREG